jgi:gluconate 2-dehydrogenase gamma chain
MSAAMLPPALSRRAVLGQIAGLAALALPNGVIAAPGSAAASRAASFLSVKELAFVKALADTIIPATDTPGAVAAKVHLTVHAYLTGWASADRRGRWRTNLDLLAKALSGRSAFHLQTPAVRERRLAALDAEIFADPAHRLAGYRDIKSVIVQAYYLSEPGATVELDYLPIPGEWKADIPVRKNWAA